MSDVIDRANDQASEILERTIAAARCAGTSLPHTGRCHNCSEPVEQSKRFCNKDCCSDYEYRVARKSCN